jgi:2-polyprenyl-3-methyl-5-hydroxy-6-metoxy-1,4-benzoquinol methylase
MIVPCLACGSRRFRLLLSPDEVQEEGKWLRRFHLKRGRSDLTDVADFTQCDPVSIMQCGDCGTLVRNPQPTPDALARLYRHDRYSAQTLEQLFECERDFFAAKADHVSSLIPAKGSVLEVGSFVGSFLTAAESKNLKALGVDVGDDTCRFTKERGLNVRRGDFRTLEMNQTFDAVCIWNTFDQMNEPDTVLARSYELLNPNGYLVVRVPNGLFKVACLMAERCSRHARQARTAQAYNNFTTFPYLVGYTPRSIKALLGKYGFRIKEMRGETIMPLCGADSNSRAAREERRTKRAVMLASRLALDRHNLFLYPWMTIVAQKIEA